MGRVVVLTPNPAVDITYFVPPHEIGSTVRVRDVVRTPGGKGVNVARILASSGFDVTAVLPLGGTSGQWIEAELGRRGLTVAVVWRDEETRSTITVVDGLVHPTLYAESGGALHADEMRRLRRALEITLADASFFIIAGSLASGSEPEAVGQWVKLAHDFGVPVLVDMSGPALLTAAEAGADFLKPNLSELLDATGCEVELDAAGALMRIGAKTVIVSRGESGMAAHTADESVSVPSIPQLTGNPTGAGDAASAGFVAGLLEGRDLAAALRRAAAFGSAAVLQPTAGQIDSATAATFTARLDNDWERP